jgi:hypothetical protein
MDDAEFLEFSTYYYQRPRVDLAADALKWYARSPWVQDPLSTAPMAYFFARLAQNHPSLVPDYAAVLRDLSDQGEVFVRNVLKSTPITVNAVERALRTPTDNDLLWVEFAVSGSKAPVVRLIEVLEWTDRVRDKLDGWLRQPVPRGFRSLFDRGYQTQRELRNVAGIVCDRARQNIDTPDDLDCRCMLDGLVISQERFERVRRVLPFPLSSDDLYHIGIKASAKWSLASNCEQHPKVRDVCVAEAARRSGRARLALLDIIHAA